MLDAEGEPATSAAASWLAASWPTFVAPDVAHRHDRGERQDRIADLVSRHVIPRLLAEHEPVAGGDVHPRFPHQDVGAFVKLVLGADVDAAAARMADLLARGLTAETLFVELLEPAARHLGEMWERDECDFVDVTLGVGRLQGLLAIFGDPAIVRRPADRRTAYLTVTPGDQHYFGVSMVERFMRGGGWDVHVEDDATLSTIASRVSERWFAVAGVSLGSETRLDKLAEAIRTIRRSSLNPAIGILVGGPVFGDDPGLAMRLGADATAANGPGAVVAAQKLFEDAAPRLQGRA